MTMNVIPSSTGLYGMYGPPLGRRGRRRGGGHVFPQAPLNLYSRCELCVFQHSSEYYTTYSTLHSVEKCPAHIANAFSSFPQRLVLWTYRMWCPPFLGEDPNAPTEPGEVSEHARCWLPDRMAELCETRSLAVAAINAFWLVYWLCIWPIVSGHRWSDRHPRTSSAWSKSGPYSKGPPDPSFDDEVVIFTIFLRLPS